MYEESVNRNIKRKIKFAWRIGCKKYKKEGKVCMESQVKEKTG